MQRLVISVVHNTKTSLIPERLLALLGIPAAMDTVKAPELLVLPQLSVLTPKTGLLIAVSNSFLVGDASLKQMHSLHSLSRHTVTIYIHNIHFTNSQDLGQPHGVTCSTVTITSEVDSHSSCLSYTTNMAALFGRLRTTSPLTRHVHFEISTTSAKVMRLS